MARNLRITVWNEFRLEKIDERVAAIYPEGIHVQIANYLEKYNEFKVRTATFDESDHGLTRDVLSSSDVIVWWGHKANEEVRDDIAAEVVRHVYGGMGLIVLHSAHYSKVFRRLMGTTCSLKWRIAAEKERLWVVEPDHPIVHGIGEYIAIDQTEMYGEPFDVPTPDTVVLISWFEGGEVFRSGCCYNRGKGKVFYFRPGHETYPIFHHEGVMRVIANACRWAASDYKPSQKSI